MLHFDRQTLTLIAIDIAMALMVLAVVMWVCKMLGGASPSVKMTTVETTDGAVSVPVNYNAPPDARV